MDRGPHYRLLTRTLRPARICAAIRGGDGWAHRALRLIEGLSVTWGGSHDLVVSLEEDGSLDPNLWPLVELFDADEWARFVTTPRHLQMIGEHAFEPWLKLDAQSLVDQGGIDLEAARRCLMDFAMNEPLDGWQLPEALVADVARRTGSANDIRGSKPVVRCYLADQPPPGTTIVDLRPLLPRVRVPNVDHLPIALQLIAAMRWGALSPSAKEQLSSSDCPTLSAVIDDTNIDRLLTAAWFGAVRWWPKTIPFPAGLPQPETFDDNLFFTETPFAISAIGCLSLHRPDHRFQPHQAIVVGSEARDFCYALGLSRVGAPAIWLPPDLLDDAVYGPAAARALAGGLRSARQNYSVDPRERRIQVCSLSLSPSELASIAAQISDLLQTTLAGTITVVDAVALPQHRIPTLGDPQHYDDRLEEPFDGDTMVRRLPPLLPSALQSADPWKLQWWIEVEQPETPLPARSWLNTTVVAADGAFGPSARCGHNQVSYPSHSMGLVVGGSSLAQISARPRLRFPDASSVFRSMFGAAGYECAESSAGRFRRLATEMWGGLDAFSSDLGAADRFAILSAWLAEDDRMTDGPRPPGIQLRARRYLSFDEIQRVGKLDDCR